MSYNELPSIPMSITRGNTTSFVFQDFTVDGVPLDLTTACLKVQFKTAINAGRYVDFELTEGNGGLAVTPDSMTMNFGRETARLPQSRYFGDLLAKVNGDDVTLLRFELNLGGVVTTKDKNDEC